MQINRLYLRNGLFYCLGAIAKPAWYYNDVQRCADPSALEVLHLYNGDGGNELSEL